MLDRFRLFLDWCLHDFLCLHFFKFLLFESLSLGPGRGFCLRLFCFDLGFFDQSLLLELFSFDALSLGLLFGCESLSFLFLTGDFELPGLLRLLCLLLSLGLGGCDALLLQLLLLAGLGRDRNAVILLGARRGGILPALFKAVAWRVLELGWDGSVHLLGLSPLLHLVEEAVPINGLLFGFVSLLTSFGADLGGECFNFLI